MTKSHTNLLELTLSKALLVLFSSIFIIYSTFAFAEKRIRLHVKGDANGIIEIQLNEVDAPIHTQRIKKLAKEGAYDGVVFHRVIDGFMAQTGDVKYGNIANFKPEMVGMGGSKYSNLVEEFSSESFARGTVGMARSRDPNSANSQFFIMFAPAPHLDGKYTVIGQVTKGLDIVMKIKKGNASQNGSVSSPDYIEMAEIVE